ncbi:MTH1187 family thiamine-binding protein [Fundidesulfovibrio soli]|uniref:MTH1187 family thiamine-binding protein n=1 Tax=Fundidesulfovibrio soli TaxID=2922716 RepID=UPI001FAF34BA
MSVIAELSIFPMGQAGSLSPAVAKAVAVIRDSGLPYQLGPMGTCIEGEFEEVMDVVNRCFEALRQGGHERIYLTIKADWRKGRQGGLASKTEAVATHLRSDT